MQNCLDIKKQSQYSEGSDTYTEIGNRITETAEAAKKANDAFEKLTQNDFVSKNSEALKNAGKKMLKIMTKLFVR